MKPSPSPVHMAGECKEPWPGHILLFTKCGVVAANTSRFTEETGEKVTCVECINAARTEKRKGKKR